MPFKYCKLRLDPNSAQFRPIPHTTAGICGVAAPRWNSEHNPEVFLMNGQDLARTKTAIAHKDPKLISALAHLLKQAESALNDGPFTVMNKTVTPPSGDKHDYMSLGIYWWPNPQTKDGLPYIRRDGQRNPLSESDGSDSARMGKMIRAVDTLTLAYYFTDGEKYAARAAFLLRTWFLNTNTRMSPHLKYGQAIPGRVEGRGIGIIDTVRLLAVVDATGLLKGSESWTDNDHQALKQWFEAYLKWLQTSKHGRDESRASNNHGTWYDVQVACFALFVDDRKTARRILGSAGERRISRQIGPDGRQKHELARPKSFDYSIYNLNAMFRLARLGEHVGVDLWHFKVKENASIRAALDYLAPYADAEKEWPHKQITELNRAKLLPLLRQGLRAYEDPEYLNMIRKIPEPERVKDMSRLLYPTSTTQQRVSSNVGKKHVGNHSGCDMVTL
jgi:hypothetical protein